MDIYIYVYTHIHIKIFKCIYALDIYSWMEKPKYIHTAEYCMWHCVLGINYCCNVIYNVFLFNDLTIDQTKVFSLTSVWSPPVTQP